MKNKFKYMTVASLIAVLLPFSVSAGASEDISGTGTSSADATVNSVDYSSSTIDPMYYIAWGDMKFDYKYDEGTSTATWTKVNSRQDYCDQDSNMIKTSNVMKKNMKTTISFTSDIQDVTATYNGYIQRMMTDEEWTATGNNIDPDGDGIAEDKCKYKDTVDLSAINSNSYITEHGQEAEVSFNLSGGSYQDVESAFETDSKKIGTFTVTIEDAE